MMRAEGRYHKKTCEYHTYIIVLTERDGKVDACLY